MCRWLDAHNMSSTMGISLADPIEDTPLEEHLSERVSRRLSEASSGWGNRAEAGTQPSEASKIKLR